MEAFFVVAMALVMLGVGVLALVLAHRLHLFGARRPSQGA